MSCASQNDKRSDFLFPLRAHVEQGGRKCHFPWDAAERSVKTEVKAFIMLEKDGRRSTVRPRVDSEQQPFSVFDSEIRELRTVTLVPCVSLCLEVCSEKINVLHLPLSISPYPRERVCVGGSRAEIEDSTCTFHHATEGPTEDPCPASCCF